MIAQLLVSEGFTSLEEIAETPIEELNQIEGFQEEISVELRNRAIAWLDAKAEELANRQADLGISEELATFEGLSPEWVILLGEADVKTRDDLADLAGDELVEILGEGKLTEVDANAIIMKAREHWFAEEDAAAEAANDEQLEEETKEAASNA